jgi:GH24 family phage-related lysozyme (muramidase)
MHGGRPVTLVQRLIALGLTSAVASGAAYIATKEGVSYVPYLDGGGVKTWCYGQTVGTAKPRYTVQECDQDLVQMYREYHKAIELYVPPDAPASVHAAFTSLAINTGKAGWVNTRFTVPLSKRDWLAACNAIEAPWKGKHGVARGYKATINGTPSRGLENRRRDDAAYCRGGL